MKINFEVDRNCFILLELLYFFDFYNIDDDIYNKLIDLRNIIEQKLFKDLSSKTNGKDIIDEKLFVEYIL